MKNQKNCQMLILIAQKKGFDALNVTQKKPQLSVFASFSWFFQKWYFAESWGSLRCKYPKAEKFCPWISVALSTLISVITLICGIAFCLVVTTRTVLSTHIRVMMRISVDNATLIRRRNFSSYGVLTKYQLRPHSYSGCCWEPY